MIVCCLVSPLPSRFVLLVECCFPKESFILCSSSYVRKEKQQRNEEQIIDRDDDDVTHRKASDGWRAIKETR